MKGCRETSEHADSIWRPSDEQAARMRAIPEFAANPYGFLSPAETLDYFQRKYIANLRSYCDISRSVLVDCGCGHGWNALAYLLHGGWKAIGVDTDEIRLGVAKRFAEILGLSDRSLFCCASIAALPFADRSVDIFSSIETLEHLSGAANGALREIARTADSLVLVSTPNKAFPVVAHDTRLPLAHWMPPRFRKYYARLFRREDRDAGNLFVTPWQIVRAFSDFQLASNFLGFRSYAEYSAMYPHYLPYIGGGHRANLPWIQRTFYSMSFRVLGRRSFYVLPSLTGIFRRRHVDALSRPCRDRVPLSNTTSDRIPT